MHVMLCDGSQVWMLCKCRPSCLPDKHIWVGGWIVSPAYLSFLLSSAARKLAGNCSTGVNTSWQRYQLSHKLRQLPGEDASHAAAGMVPVVALDWLGA